MSFKIPTPCKPRIFLNYPDLSTLKGFTLYYITFQPHSTSSLFRSRSEEGGVWQECVISTGQSLCSRIQSSLYLTLTGTGTTLCSFHSSTCSTVGFLKLEQQPGFKVGAVFYGQNDRRTGNGNCSFSCALNKLGTAQVLRSRLQRGVG